MTATGWSRSSTRWSPTRTGGSRPLSGPAVAGRLRRPPPTGGTLARTPLFRTLRRALALARLANASGRAPVELVELERARRAARRGRAWTRRELLASGVAAGAGWALGCRTANPPATGGEVAIVGGGIAGLVCAWRLSAAGVAARIYEAQKRIGGRIWSLRGAFPDDLVCELGGELVDSDHATLHALCAELGLELDDFAGDDPELATDLWWFDGRRVSDAEVVEAFRPVAARIDAVWGGMSGEVVTYRDPNGGETIDRMSLAEWLEGSGAEDWFRTLLDVAYTTEYGLEASEQSPWNLLMLIDSSPDPFRVFGASDERYHVRGGNDLVPTRLAARLGDQIELEQRLEAVRTASDGRYRLSFAGPAGAHEVAAERVVLTLPFTMLREVELDVELPPVKRRAIDELGYGTNAKLMVGFSERLWRSAGGSNGSVLSDLPFQLVWESTRLQPGRAGILVGYTGGRRGVAMGEGSPAEQAERFARELDRVFPGISGLRLNEARFHWPSFPWARGSYACYRPGQWTSIAGSEGERVGALHFAGEHTSYDFQGFMEGGAESGARAAAEILADLGRPPARNGDSYRATARP